MSDHVMNAVLGEDRIAGDKRFETGQRPNTADKRFGGVGYVPNSMRYVRVCAWAGLVLLAATIVFWGVLGQNIPPYSPALTAEEFATQIRAHALEIKIGMVFQLPFSALYFIWGVAISKVMQRVERDNDVLSTI